MSDKLKMVIDKVYHELHDREAGSWLDNLGFLSSNVESSILCVGGVSDYNVINVRQPDNFKIILGSAELSNIGSIHIGYGSTTVMVNFEEAYLVADNYDWAEAA